MTAAIDAAVAGTSSNTNAVATLDTPFADPDMEAMRQTMNELILAAVKARILRDRRITADYSGSPAGRSLSLGTGGPLP